MKRRIGRPRQRGLKIFERRMRGAIEFHRHNRTSGCGGELSWRDAAQLVADRHGFSRATVENHARSYRHAALLAIHAAKYIRSTGTQLVLDTFAEEIDAIGIDVVVEASRLARQEAIAAGLQYETFLRSVQGRARLLELIRAIQASGHAG